MLVPDQTFRRSGRWLALAASAALLASLIPLSGVAAAGPTLVAASPTDVSADYTGTANYATVGTISVTESAPGDLTAAGTITFAVPTGFQFANAAPTVTSGGNGLAASVSSYGTTQFVVTIATASTGTASSLTITNVRVQPTSGTIGSGVTGNITATGSLVSGNAGTLTEVAGATSSLTFTTQPSSSSLGGAILAQQPEVTDLDKFGNPRASKSVTLSILSGPSGGALSCTPASNQATTDASGVATWVGCSLSKAGTYYLRAYDGIYSPQSTAIVVSVGPAVDLAFTTYPASTTTTSLGTLGVAAVDLGGNTVTSATGTVTLTINKNSGSFSCTGGLSRTLSSGMAAFTGCVETVAAAGYTITATGSGGTINGFTATASFSVTSGPPTKLAFYWGAVGITTAPTGSTGGTAFPTQPVIVEQDANGNPVTSDSTTVVTLAITATGTGAALTCTSGNSLHLAAGVAMFAGCSINKVGTFQLTATSSPYYTPATSNSFYVTAGPPTKLTFTAQPTSGAAGQAFPIQPVVAITDAGGNTATTSSATVTLSLSGGTAGAALSCTGGLSKTTVSGVATFSGCSINTQGSNYYLTATATGVYPVVYLSPVTSNPFSVTLQPAQLTLTPSSNVIIWAKPVTLTAQFGTNGANKSFTLQASLDKVHWYTIANLTTNSSGVASFSYTPATNLWYQAVFAGATDLGAATTTPFRVVVRQIALLRPTNAGKVVAITVPTTLTWHVTVRPNRPELPRSKVGWEFYIYRDGHWHYLTTRYAYTNSAGVATYSYTFGTPGQWFVRAKAYPTPYNANSYTTPLNRYSVR